MKRILPVLALLALGLASCAAPPAEPNPPDIVYGQDICDACGMIISEARFAAAAALANGEALKFDDIGDMLRYRAAHSDLAVAAWFVHDHPSETWLNAANATYVLSPEVATPMGHGLAAFSDPAAADAFAAEFHGEVLSWESLGRRFAEG